MATITKMKAERLARNWNQTTLAFHARMSMTEISRIETGRFKPYNGQAERLARVLGLAPESLLETVEA